MYVQALRALTSNDNAIRPDTRREDDVELEKFGTLSNNDVDTWIELRVKDLAERFHVAMPCRRITAPKEVMEAGQRLHSDDPRIGIASLERDPYGDTLARCNVLSLEHDRRRLQSRGQGPTSGNEARRRRPLTDVLDKAERPLDAQV